MLIKMLTYQVDVKIIYSHKNSSKIIVGDFRTTFLIMERTDRKKVNKEIDNLNTTINQLDLTVFCMCVLHMEYSPE